MQFWTMSKRSLEEAKDLSDNDQESDDNMTSSSKKRRASGSYMASDDKVGIESVRPRPHKTQRKIQSVLVDKVQKDAPYIPPSSGRSMSSSGVAGLALKGIHKGKLHVGTVPDAMIATSLHSSGMEVDGRNAELTSTIASNAGTGTGQTHPNDLFRDVQQQSLPATVAPSALLLPPSTNQPLRATSYHRLQEMPNVAYPSSESAFLQQRLTNNRLASRVSNAMQDLMELELLQSRLMNYPSSMLLQNTQLRPNLTQSTERRDLLSTMQVAGSSSMLNNRRTQLDTSNTMPMNPYLSASLPLDQILAGTQPPMNVLPPIQASSLGMRQIGDAYGRSFQIPQQEGLGRFESSDWQRQQERQVTVDHQGGVPVLYRDIGRVEPMDLDTDSASLSRFQCLARQQIEFFEANESDVAAGARGRNNPISLGQVGIRCRHCKSFNPATRGRAAVYFPTKFDLVYQTAVNMTSTHLCIHCKEVPTETREQLVQLRDQRSTVGGGKSYWAEATKKLGIVETQRGLRFKE